MTDVVAEVDGGEWEDQQPAAMSVRAPRRRRKPAPRAHPARVA